MALREYQCPKCGPFDMIYHGAYPKQLDCPDCGKPSTFNLVPKGARIKGGGGFRTIVDFRDGWDPGLGEYVSTKRQRQNLLDENHLRRVKD
jgi:putative FmdB family regulatory protein